MGRKGGDGQVQHSEFYHEQHEGANEGLTAEEEKKKAEEGHDGICNAIIFATERRMSQSCELLRDFSATLNKCY